MADNSENVFLTNFVPQVISHLNEIYLSGYHFIKMLDRPVDLPLRFIIVCVTEPLTFREERDISAKLDTDKLYFYRQDNISQKEC